MSEEEKQTKKQKVEDNRRLRAMSRLPVLKSSPSIVPNDGYVPLSLDQYDDTSSTDSNEYKYALDDNLRAALTKVEREYARAVQLNISVIQGLDSSCLRSLSELVDVANEPAHISALRLITFFKLTPEFNVSRFDVISPSIISG